MQSSVAGSSTTSLQAGPQRDDTRTGDSPGGWHTALGGVSLYCRVCLYFVWGNCQNIARMLYCLLSYQNNDNKTLLLSVGIYICIHVYLSNLQKGRKKLELWKNYIILLHNNEDTQYIFPLPTSKLLIKTLFQNHMIG